MRDRTEVEREIFEARQDLEQSLSELEHKLREKIEVRARATHAAETFVQRHRRAIAIIAACAIGLFVLRRLTARG